VSSFTQDRALRANAPARAHSKTDEAVLELERRLGNTHARLRLGIERDHEAQIFGQGLNFFHIENWYSGYSVLRKLLKTTGLYWVGRRNAARIVVRDNTIQSAALPSEFDGFTILHLSDLHVEFSEQALQQAAAVIDALSYDLCVFTGDYRALTYGSHEAAILGVEALRRHIKSSIYAVLGNHDTILMVPELERLGMRILLNEAVEVTRAGSDQKIYLAGVDDAHYFQADNLEKAVVGIPADAFSILLSHTPEIYRPAAHCDFDVMLSGHTHGGQICLPGGVPLKLNAVIPRRFGAGSWRFGYLQGYTSTGLGTSIVTSRFNCPPEITLHRLRTSSR
jgi:predicted MPP superfamily phosphohydrolase